MPWCDDCARFWSPPTLQDGACPTCGAQLEPAAEPQARPRAPWHFKLMLVAIVLYVGYRAYQGVFWAGHSWLHLF
jgi:hypothetical protein